MYMYMYIAPLHKLTGPHVCICIQLIQMYLGEHGVHASGSVGCLPLSVVS